MMSIPDHFPEPFRYLPLSAWLKREFGCRVHRVAVDGPDEMTTGMRVRARWAAEPVGAITDIECFEPEFEPGDPS